MCSELIRKMLLLTGITQHQLKNSLGFTASNGVATTYLLFLTVILNFIIPHVILPLYLYWLGVCILFSIDDASYVLLPHQSSQESSHHGSMFCLGVSMRATSLMTIAS